jgi:hypothetical protein
MPSRTGPRLRQRDFFEVRETERREEGHVEKQMRSLEKDLTFLEKMINKKRGNKRGRVRI